MSADSGAATGRGQWWRQAATLLALFGLLVTMLFNTVAVWQGLESDRQARELSEIALLPGLVEGSRKAERSLDAAPIVSRLCEPVSALSRSDEADLREYLNYSEYVASLFNHRTLTLANTRSLLTARLIYGWRIGRHFLGTGQLSFGYPELTRFVRSTPQSERGQDPCRS